MESVTLSLTSSGPLANIVAILTYQLRATGMIIDFISLSVFLTLFYTPQVVASSSYQALRIPTINIPGPVTGIRFKLIEDFVSGEDSFNCAV